MCPDCRLALIPHNEPRHYTFAAVIGFLLILCGIAIIALVMLTGAMYLRTEPAITKIITGLLLIGAGIVIDRVGSGTRLVMICPACRKAGKHP